MNLSKKGVPIQNEIDKRTGGEGFRKSETDLLHFEKNGNKSGFTKL